MVRQRNPKARAKPYSVTGSLFLPSPVARRLWWHTLFVGRAYYREKRTWRSFLHAGAALLWVESGTGFLEIGSSRWRLEKGPKFWLFNFEKPRTFRPSGTLIVRTLGFAGPGLHAWLEEVGGSSQAQFELEPKRAAKVRVAYSRLGRLTKAQPAGWEWQAHMAITRLWQELLAARGLLTPGAAPPPEPIARALHALDAEPFRDWQAYELASIAKLSYWPFRRLFRQHMRETVHEHLQRRRADAAKQLLADPRLQIKAIAQRLHFTSGRYFSFFFRSHTGMSPTEFRDHLEWDQENEKRLRKQQ